MTQKSDFESQNCAVFDLQFYRKDKNIFMAVFIVLRSCLFATKLSCLQKNNFGHTIEPVHSTILVLVLCNFRPPKSTLT